MKKLIGILLALSVLFLASGCSEEGTNLDGQKVIQFSFAQQASNENWEVVDEVSGTYYNLENLIESSHKLKVEPTNGYEGDSLAVSFKIGGETVSLKKEGEKEQKIFEAVKADHGTYQLKTDGFLHFDENDKLWDEKIEIVIEYGDQTDLIELS